MIGSGATIVVVKRCSETTKPKQAGQQETTVATKTNVENNR
jgi:hypothetical protein